MTRKLLLIIALGATLAIVAAGTATSITVGGVQVNSPTDGVLPACSNLIDDDGDGLVDLDDPGCSSPLDTSEVPTSGGSGGSSGSGTTTSGGSGSTTTTTGGGTTTTSGGSSTTGSGKAGKKTTGGGKAGKKTTGGGKTPGLFGKQAKKGQGAKQIAETEKGKIEHPTLRNPDGSPANTNPSLTVAQFGPAPIGVPNFVIDSFEIPPFLLPIYQSCGTEYGIPWQVLAGINKIETAFGTNLNVSSAGAEGWMQFIPSTWAAYGVDANNDGRKDPYNPVDAICAAARYLRAAGGDHNVRQAIFAYNHADWYVDEVLLYANQYGKLPDALVGSLTGLTEGAHFPVAADARYADDINDATALARSNTARKGAGNAADVVSSDANRRSINIYSSLNAPVVAVNDGVIKKIGDNAKLGRYIVLQDAYGNSYTYAHLGSIAQAHPVPRQQGLSSKDFKLETPNKDSTPTAAASAGDNSSGGSAKAAKPVAHSAPANSENARQRLFALPHRSGNTDQSSVGGQIDQLLGRSVPGYETFKSALSSSVQFDSNTMQLKPLKKGSKVTGGTVIGRVGQSDAQPPHLNFAIRPAGRGAPTIDPKPILDGWKLLETTAIYRAADKNPFTDNPTVGQVLLMSKGALEQRVLNDPALSIYSCGRNDIATGQIDRRVLAVMEYLVAKGYHLTITSLKCGHSYLTSSGNVSAHSYGSAVDIAAVNGIPIAGHQGPGTITEAVIKDLLLLQGSMRPAQIISLMNLGPPTFILPDHWNHIHVGYTFTTAGSQIKQLGEILKPEQWQRLIQRLGQIQNPKVPSKPSAAALPAKGDSNTND
ncbi:MAG TPA: lytic murein transglycosylase [Solirubrobacterales bacterium]|nr:lytic murein transglycosylase [Solirubrobacterales bacterium]